MSRDGGFALLASVRQVLADALLAAYAASVAPQSITVPPISIGGTVVNVTGSVSLLPPKVTFRSRADGLITTTVSVGALLSLSATGQPTQLVNAVFSTSVDVPLATTVVNNQVLATVNLTQIVVNQLGVQYLSAPPSPLFQNAVANPAVVAAINTFLQQFPPLPVTIPLMSASTNTVVSRGVPPGQDPHYSYRNRSTFPPYPPRFIIQLAIGRVVLRQFDGAITVAADLTGITNGDPTSLVDLTSTWSPLVSMVEQESYDHSVSSGSSGPGRTKRAGRRSYQRRSDRLGTRESSDATVGRRPVHR